MARKIENLHNIQWRYEECESHWITGTFGDVEIYIDDLDGGLNPTFQATLHSNKGIVETDQGSLSDANAIVSVYRNYAELVWDYDNKMAFFNHLKIGN